MKNKNESEKVENDRKPSARITDGGTAAAEKQEDDTGDDSMGHSMMINKKTGASPSSPNNNEIMNAYWDNQFRRESLDRRKNVDLPSEEFKLAQHQQSDEEEWSTKALQKSVDGLCTPVSKEAPSSRAVSLAVWREAKHGGKPPLHNETSLRPGAYALPGPGVNNAENNATYLRRNSSSGEVVASLEETEQSEISEDVQFARRESTAQSIAKADVVDDAEPIFVAQDVRRDNFKRNIAKGLLGLFALIAIVVMVIKLTKDDPEGVVCPDDDVCCLPVEEQNVFERCFCTNSTAGTYGKLTELGGGIYHDQLILLQMTRYWTYFGSADWDVESCNPLNQGLLHFSQNEGFGLSPEQRRNIPVEMYSTFLYLVITYTLMNGFDWDRSKGFLKSLDVCDWEGVGCLFIDVVHEFRLSDNGLSGELGPSIGEATQLRVLDFSSNNISGTIPPEIANLSNLNELRLAELTLQGTLPESLGTMERLRFLSLQNNQLSGTIPPSYFAMPEIRNLEISLNKLTGTLPPTGYGAGQLGVLRLNGNNFTGPIPSELSNLSNLELLNIGNNKFTGTIPEFLGTMPRLQFINLLESGLTGRIPDSFCWNDRNPTDYVSIVAECATIELCECCSNQQFTFAPIRVRCAEDIPAQAMGFIEN